MKKQSEKQPKDYEVLSVGGKPQLVVNFLIEEKHEEERSYWEYRSVELPIGDFSYGTIVSGIIDDVYSNDQMQAIINNKLIGEGEEEFDKMQAFRVYSKQLAKDILNQLNEGKEK